jgi:hypothetical protein
MAVMGDNSMRKALRILVITTVGAAGLASGADAGDADRVQLSMSRAAVNGAGQPGEITVEGAAGRYDRVETVSLPLSFALSAGLGVDFGSFKIVGSELFLKAEGTGKDAHGVAALPGGVPNQSISLRQEFTLGLSPNGPLAQNAIALCNGLAASERTAVRKLEMSVAVVWRVTTGRFNFKWTNYDHVAPSDDIQNNPDFYADQASIDAEAIAGVPVLCQPLPGAAVATIPSVAPVKQASLKPVASETTPASQPGLDKPIVITPVTTASVAYKGRPQCDGGMVRQIGSGDSGFLCLCPGNTKRVETGDNAFACERPRR